MDEEKQEEAKEEEPETPAEDKDIGVSPEVGKEDPLENRKAELKEREELLKREKDVLAEEKKMAERKVLGGKTEAGHIPKKPEPETDEEYTERFQKGEVDPLQDDGAK